MEIVISYYSLAISIVNLDGNSKYFKKLLSVGVCRSVFLKEHMHERRNPSRIQGFDRNLFLW